MPAINRTGKPLLTRTAPAVSPSQHARLSRPPVLNALHHLTVSPRSPAAKAMSAAPAAWSEQIDQGRRTPKKPATSLPALPKGSKLLARRAELASARHVERLAQLPDCPKPQATRQVTSRPLESDVLAAYFSKAENRQRFECAAYSGQLLHNDVSDNCYVCPPGFFAVQSYEPEPVAGSSEDVSTGLPAQQQRPENMFLNAFSSKEWRMQLNYRNNTEAPYFATDAVLAQYEFISKKHGFYGELPDRIVRAHVANAKTLALMADDSLDMATFLRCTVNGKHTARMLDALGMKAISMDWSAAAHRATIHVQPLLSPDLGVSPRPARHRSKYESPA